MHSAPGAGNLVAGRYRLLTQLGRGAMGIVWHGRDELLDRDVAVKQIVLGPMASEQDSRESYERTIREARTAARLSHPGVVTVYDVAEQDGMPWIVMELIRARPLEQVIAEDGPLTPPLAAQLGLGLLDALACAHAAGVLHRDVKPSNVLITPEGKAILTDFGIAAIQGDPGLTREGLVAGTPGFSPPERVRGGDATPASDLWSLGATLYAAVEGRGPFDRAGGSAAIVASIATEQAPRAPSAGPLAPAIDALLRSDPAHRPDAAMARRMLVAAWTDARRASRLSQDRGDVVRGGAVSLRAGTDTARRAAGVARDRSDLARDGAAPAAGAAAHGPRSAGAAELAHSTAAPADDPAAEPVGAALAGSAATRADEADTGRGGTAAPLAGGRAGSTGLAGTTGRAVAAAAGLDATTATQVVTVVGSDGPALPARAAGLAAAPALVSEAGVLGGALAVSSGAATAPGSASNVVPDLMATPVFAELRMPGLAAPAVSANPQVSPPEAAATEGQYGCRAPWNGEPGPAGRLATGRPARRPASWLVKARDTSQVIGSRRGLMLTAPLAATAIVAGIVFLAFPGFGDTLFKGSWLHPGAAGTVTRSARTGGPGGAAPGHARRQGIRPARHHAGQRAPGRSGSPGGPSHLASPGPNPSNRPSPTGQPSPSGSPIVSPTASPSPSPAPTSTSPPSTGTTLPAGYAWQSVTAGSVGTTAGWRLGAPAAWVLTSGVQSVIAPAAGAARLRVDLAPFVAAAPVREARRLQAAAIANRVYRRYHLISILPRRFHGWPAATWTFWWKPAGRPAVDVVEVLFTATTTAGPQAYDISMSAPAYRADYASHVLAVALRTFSPLP